MTPSWPSPASVETSSPSTSASSTTSCVIVRRASALAPSSRRAIRTRSRLTRTGERFDGQEVTIASGTLIAPALAEVGDELAELTGARVRVVPVTNTAFGERVKVSGLLCGHDIIRAVQDVETGIIALPRPSLDYFGRQFLDSITVEELRARVPAPVVFASQWSEVVEALRGVRPEPGRLPVTNGAFWSEEREKVPAGGSWVPA